MAERYQPSWGEWGCLVVLWILSPLAVLYAWFFAQGVRLIQWSVHEDLRGRHEGDLPSWSEWAVEWWHQGGWLVVLGAVTIPVLFFAYLWLILSTVRILFDRWGRR